MITNRVKYKSYVPFASIDLNDQGESASSVEKQLNRLSLSDESEISIELNNENMIEIKCICSDKDYKKIRMALSDNASSIPKSVIKMS